MTHYQRGNRDGLLNLAAELDKLADAQEDECRKWRRAPGYRLSGGLEVLANSAAHREAALRQAAALARRRAEAVPDDPARCLNCSEPGAEPHLCPYALDVHGKEQRCNCCPACERECALDI